MKKNTFKLLFMAVLAVFLVTSGLLVKTIYGYRKAEKDYNDISYEAVKVVPGVLDGVPHTEGGSGQDAGSFEDGNGTFEDKVDLNRTLVIDFDSLKKKNPEIVAWLDIPGTGISYPVTQSQDNEFYITHGIYGQKSGTGAIFMDYRNKSDLSDDNTILFGHNMRNGSMFAGLKKYKSADYRKSRPYVDLYFPDRRVRFEIYACYEETASGENFPTLFADRSGKEAFTAAASARSLYSTGIVPDADRHTLMLATCTGKGYSHRLVVHAVEEI